MDSISPRTYPENQHLSQTLPPSSPSNIPSPNSSCNSNNGVFHHTQQLPPLSPTTPKPDTRSESSTAYLTTFVKTDSSSFKHVVQMLTGTSETAKRASTILTPTIITNNNNHNINNNNMGLSNNHHHMIPPIRTMLMKQQQQQHQLGYKLYQRRHNDLNIDPLLPSFSNHHTSALGFNPMMMMMAVNPDPHAHAHEVMSPSFLDFPSFILSPVTPLIPDPFVRSEPDTTLTGYALYPIGNKCYFLDHVAKEKAIKEKGFFLHPSISTTHMGTETPRLLPLFPTTSPRAEAGGASSPPS